jgi:glycyl-tRNA synthetase beta chain
MVAMLDGEVVPVEFGGVTAGNATRGHRILSQFAIRNSQNLTISRPADYAELLKSGHVIPTYAEREHRIRKALDAATRTVAGARWREDKELLATVVNLTEYPSVILGNFEREYLALPEEVLVTVMRDHQKYFAVEDASGNLAPHFLAVLNTEATEHGIAVIRHGNERVLRARFNDARFFWTVDQKVPLEDRVEMLRSVTFQKDLGSYWDKTQANVRIAEQTADLGTQRGVALDKDALLLSTRLAKTDLTTELVKEFTELQGIVGGLYARAQGLGEIVAQAIYAQYTPASVEDAIPATVEGQILGLADRMQTIAAMFAIGLEPTGSKDPFALRRAANGVVKILAESELPLDLSDLLSIAVKQIDQSAKAEARVPTLEPFFRERVEFYLRDVRGFSYDVVNAVLGADYDNVRDSIARAEALTAVRGSEDFLAISAAFKRIKNILRQAAEKQAVNGVQSKKLDQKLLTDAAEQSLYQNAEKLAPSVETLRAERKYQAALEQIATLRPHVDLFFDKVMVMVEDPAVRQNRLALLAKVLHGFSSIADFSEIVAG